MSRTLESAEWKEALGTNSNDCTDKKGKLGHTNNIQIHNELPSCQGHLWLPEIEPDQLEAPTKEYLN